MTRDLSVGMQSAIRTGTVYPVILYAGEFDSGWVRLWSGTGPLVWAGDTYLGAAELGAISAVEETTEIRAGGITCTLSGIPSSLISLALQDARQGLRARLWLGLLAESGSAQRALMLSLPGSSGNNATTADSAALSVTGDIDVRIRAAAADWTPASQMYLAGRYASMSDAGFSVRLETSGVLGVDWVDGSGSYHQAVSTAATGFTDGAVQYVRATLDVDNGASGHDVTFYTSTDGQTWTQLGATVTTAGVTSIKDTALDYVIGNYTASGGLPFDGDIYLLEIRSGIDGTVVAQFDPQRGLTGDTSLSSATGEVWAVNQSGSPAAALAVPLDADFGLRMIDTPYEFFNGRLDVPVIDEGAEMSTIAISYESELVDLDKPRARRYTSEDQKADYPADLGFDFVPALQDKTVVWG